jgi:DNA-binding beta-propeller fold protein YncE
MGLICSSAINVVLLCVGLQTLAGQTGEKAPGGPPMGYKPVPDFFQLPPDFSFGMTSGIAIGPQGKIYVFNRGAHPLVEFDANGKFLRSLCETGVFMAPHGIRVDREGNIWTVDVASHMVVKISQKGNVLKVLGRRAEAGTNKLRFNRPADIAIADSGEFYVADGYGNSRVVKFDRDGNYLLEWGKKGTGPGEFNIVHAVIVDNRGRVYVGDRENYRVQVFDESGKFLTQWASVGSPWGLDFTADRRHILMADGYNNRVVKLNLDGQIVGVQGGPGRAIDQFIHAHAIAAAANGDFYVAEIENWRAQKFTQK